MFLVLYAAAALLFRKRFRDMGERLVPFVLYAAVILAMLSMALCLPTYREPWCWRGGACLFAVSDLTLARNILNAERCTKRSEAISLAFYYGGLYLIALSVWI